MCGVGTAPQGSFVSRVLGVIPARLGSIRLSRKPLQPLLGAPLIIWVWDRVRGMTAFDRVVVATDSEEVEAACDAWGAEVVMTSPEHESGTDRVWEAAGTIAGEYPIVVNIQGDEPLVEADHVEDALGLVRAGMDVGTCATPILTEGEFRDPAVVKVVRRTDGSALYFSRAAIPYRRDVSGADRPVERRPPWLRHVGIYAYARDALERWVRLSPSALEAEEHLEQLRALQDGMSIGVAVVEGAERGVDTPGDLARTEGRLRELGRDPPAKAG